MSFNIISQVVDKDKCIGCGVCDTICPVNVLSMNFNKSGKYQPFESKGCLDKCTLCLDVCPFTKENESEYELAKKLYSQEVNIKYHNDLGYFLNTYEIYKNNDYERLQSASGGAGNWFQKLLLETNSVDHIITVESNNDPDKLFQFSVFSNINDLEKIKGSVYYPVEVSEVLDYVKENEGTYAITALPCYAKAIRLAQNKNHKLRKRIKIIIGLVCGQSKSKKYTEELAKLVIDKKPISSVNYRIKNPNKLSTQYAFKFTDIDGNSKKLDWCTEPGIFWHNRMFTPSACNLCTDVFALDSDIVLMDAWLDEYTKDYRGHTLVITRTLEIDNLIKSSKEVTIKKIDYNKVYESQKNVVISKNNFRYGNKNYLQNKIINYKKEIQKLSNEDYPKYKCDIELIFNKISKTQKLIRLLTLPQRAYKKIHTILKGKI